MNFTDSIDQIKQRYQVEDCTNINTKTYSKPNRIHPNYNLILISFIEFLQFLNTGLYKLWDSNIGDLFSDTYTLSFCILILNSQCVGVAKEVSNIKVPQFNQYLEFEFDGLKRYK